MHKGRYENSKKQQRNGYNVSTNLINAYIPCVKILILFRLRY